MNISAGYLKVINDSKEFGINFELFADEDEEFKAAAIATETALFAWFEGFWMTDKIDRTVSLLFDS